MDCLNWWYIQKRKTSCHTSCHLFVYTTQEERFSTLSTSNNKSHPTLKRVTRPLGQTGHINQIKRVWVLDCVFLLWSDPPTNTHIYSGHYSINWIMSTDCQLVLFLQNCCLSLLLIRVIVHSRVNTSSLFILFHLFWNKNTSLTIVTIG